VTAYLYDWNMLPIGQQLWYKELMSFKEFPPDAGAGDLEPRRHPEASAVGCPRERLGSPESGFESGRPERAARFLHQVKPAADSQLKNGAPFRSGEQAISQFAMEEDTQDKRPTLRYQTPGF
jgi:hypothetical protein